MYATLSNGMAQGRKLPESDQPVQVVVVVPIVIVIVIIIIAGVVGVNGEGRVDDSGIEVSFVASSCHASGTAGDRHGTNGPVFDGGHDEPKTKIMDNDNNCYV